MSKIINIFQKSEPPVKLVVCSTRETLGYWPMSKDILKGPPTALRFHATTKVVLLFSLF